MAWRNRSQHRCNRRYSANVTPKMADFLGCNPVTPIPEMIGGREGVSDLAHLVLFTIIQYRYVHKGNKEYRAENRSLSYLSSGIGVTRLQPAETLGFWGYISGYEVGLLGVTSRSAAWRKSCAVRMI